LIASLISDGTSSTPSAADCKHSITVVKSPFKTTDLSRSTHCTQTKFMNSNLDWSANKVSHILIELGIDSS
jgi:hypothetical protein